jgi:TatD DNase family protein
MDLPYIDIHTHRCAPQAGVERLCVYRLGSGDAESPAPFVAGVHPWDVAQADFSLLDYFTEAHSGLVGVGEIGLDFAREAVDRSLQVEWLNRQLAVAERLGLPVVVHSVRAYNEMALELKNFRLKSVVFHGFIGSPELMNQLSRSGYAFSFGAASLRSPKTREALQTIAPDRLFLESDDDPQADIRALYDTVAALRQVDLPELKEALYANYKRVFYG